MSRNIFGQVILLIVFLSLFVFAFSEISILEVSKVLFFILLSISTLFIAFVIIQQITAESKKVVISPTDVTFFPNLSILSSPLQKNRAPSKKARNVCLPSSSESSLDKEAPTTSSGLVQGGPELIAKVIKTWCQGDE